MIPYKIIPPFELGPIHINMYGIMFVLGILVATLLAKNEAKKKNINPETIWDLTVYLLIGIIIGARLFEVIFYNSSYYFANPIKIFAIWEGGLAFFGGFLGALITGYIYIQKHKLHFLKIADIFVIPLVVGHILGRLGDYFTGGHPGQITSLPWGIYLDGAVRHPVVLYEITGLIIILIVLLNLKKLKYFDSFLFFSYLSLYSIQRIILDFFRIETTDPRYFGFTPTQHLSLILFILTIGFMLYKFRVLWHNSLIKNI